MIAINAVVLILPEWNVNYIDGWKSTDYAGVLILPEWNVNKISLLL